MKNVIILSKCLKVTKINPKETMCQFHFKGVYHGHVVRKIHLIGDGQDIIKKGEEYLVAIQVLFVEETVIKGKIVKVKNIATLVDQT